jgi:hypothetical protein
MYASGLGIVALVLREMANRGDQFADCPVFYVMFGAAMVFDAPSVTDVGAARLATM